MVFYYINLIVGPSKVACEAKNNVKHTHTHTMITILLFLEDILTLARTRYTVYMCAMYMYMYNVPTVLQVQDVSVANDSRWVAASTLNGTTHIFPITPYGGLHIIIT